MSAQNEICTRVAEYLDSFLSNELLVETNHMVLSHLKDCPACSGRLGERQHLKSTLKRAVLSQDVPDGLQHRIHSKLHKRGYNGYRWMLAAAAVVIIAAGSWGTLRIWNRSQGGRAGLTASEATEMAARNADVLQIGLRDHIHCALDAGFANQSFTEEEMSQKLGPEYSGLVSLVKDKVPGDLNIAVAHRCRAGDRQYVHLILKNQDQVLSLVITRQNGDSFAERPRDQWPEGAAVAFHEARLQDLEVTGFQAGDFLAFVVSNLSKADNLRVASSLAPALSRFLTGLNS